MRHILQTIVMASVLLLTMTGCQKNLQKALMPDASGTPYDLYLVLDEGLRQTSLYDSLISVFEAPMECTPNGDEYFRVRNLTPENFTSSVIRIVANVVTVDLDIQNAQEPVITMERDRYAKGQVIVKMHAKNAESLAEYLPQVAQGLRRVFVNNELNRHARILAEEHQPKQMDRLAQMQQVQLYIPRAMNGTCKAAQDSTSFFWVTDGFERKTSYLVVYSVPYTDQNIFTLEGAVAVRDSIMGRNITGVGENEHMITNRKVIFPEYRAINVGGKYVGELKGLWRMENGLMAGPFICHIKLDEMNKRVVFAEGFVYAPNDGKRLLIRNLESVLYTLKLPSDNIIPEVEVTL